MFVDQDGLGLRAGLIGVEAALLRQRHGALGRHGQHRVVEGKGHGQLIEARAELIAADGALLQLGVEALDGLLDGGAGGSQVLRAAGQCKVAAPVDHGDGGGAVQVLSDEAALQATDRQHLRARIGAVDSTGGGPHQDGQGEGVRRLVDGQRAQASLRMPSALIDVDA